MTDMSTQTFIIIILGLAVVVLLILVLRQNLKKFDFKLLKGALTFSGETHEKDNGDKVRSESEDEAKRVLRWVQENLNKVNGNFILTDTVNENAQTAARLYTKLTGDIIATCFFEEPDYGNGDFANTISPGANFVRLTTSNLCPVDKVEMLNERLANFSCNARLIVIEDDIDVTKIAGIFSKLPDKSYLAFLALNDYGKTKVNKGLTFTGDIAENLYEYYKSFT